MTAIVWSQQQEAAFAWQREGRGSAIMKAAAGCGKSTTLAEMMRRAEGSVTGLVFNKAAQLDLAAKLGPSAGNKCRAATFHSAGYNALNYAWARNGAKLVIDDKKVGALYDARAEAWADGSEEKAAQLAKLRTFVLKAVGLAKQRAFGVLCAIDDRTKWYDMVYHFGLDEDLPEENGLSFDDWLERGVSTAILVLKLSNADRTRVDFNDMVYLPLVHGVRCYQVDWVFLDEGQDTNPSRRALAKKMLRPGGRMVAVGDDRQAIYGFTGADNDALDQIRREFNASTTLTLNVTRRCPKAVVAHAQQWVGVDHIQAHNEAPEGMVRQAQFLLELPKEGSQPVVLPADFNKTDAILCRYNKPLVDLAFALIRRGVACKIEGREIGAGLIKLANRWKVKSLTALLGRLDAWETREVEKATARGQEDRADRVADQAATLRVLIEKAEAEGRDKAGLIEIIESMFADDVTAAGLLTLCSAHRSKGREWDRVFLLDREKYMPSARARQEWQQVQEVNLIYVAVTRAKRELVELSWPQAEKKS